MYIHHQKDRFSGRISTSVCSFTLNEFVMVVGVIAMLTATMLPVVDQARAAAHTLSCSHHLHQLGRAHALYSDDHDGYIISALQKNRVGHWINYFYVHTNLNYEEAYRCPSLGKNASFNPYGGSGRYNVRIYANYIMNTIQAGANHSSWDSAPIANPENSWGWTRGIYNGYTSPIRRVRVTRPSDTIFVTETAENVSLIPDGGNKSEAGKHINRYIQTDHGTPITGAASANYRRVGNHHDGSFNALMGDGHIATMGESQPSQWIAWSE